MDIRKRTRTGSGKPRGRFMITICPICQLRQIPRASGRPKKTCSAPCAAVYRRLRQNMGRCIGRVSAGLLSASEDADGLPVELRTKITNLLAELDGATAGDLVAVRLREGWIAGRLIVE